MWPKVHLHFKLAKRSKQFDRSQIGGGLSGYVKSKPLGNGQIISRCLGVRDGHSRFFIKS